VDVTSKQGGGGSSLLAWFFVGTLDPKVPLLKSQMPALGIETDPRNIFYYKKSRTLDPKVQRLTSQMQALGIETDPRNTFYDKNHEHWILH
jgi:hypothetical protein